MVGRQYHCPPGIVGRSQKCFEVSDGSQRPADRVDIGAGKRIIDRIQDGRHDLASRVGDRRSHDCRQGMTCLGAEIILVEHDPVHSCGEPSLLDLLVASEQFTGEQGRP